MQTGNVTTPFGRRPMTLAQVRRQRASASIQAGKTVDKWKVFRDASTAIEKLGLQSNSLAVLDALLSFYPETELRQDAQLIVFPSNVQLCLRAHSMAGATLRRHLALLVDVGLIVRRDSANGKRYARKDASGEVETAFGFDLSPLLQRSEEIAMLAQDVAAERAALRRAKEQLTICRRDVRKLITAAIEEGVEGNWHAIEDTYVAIIARLPRSPSFATVADVLDEMQLLQAEILNHLIKEEKSGNNSPNAAPNERHIQNSNTESTIDFEPRSEKEQAAKLVTKRSEREVGLKAFPLGMVLQACPTMTDYGPGGQIGNWRDMMAAAVVVRSTLGVSPSAYEAACEAMGSENAAVAMACILERAGFINSAGAYLRDLTRRTLLGEFSLGPMLMALHRGVASVDQKAG